MDDDELQNYQDDLDTSGTDPVMNNAGDDPTKELGVDPHRFGQELGRYDYEHPADDQEGEPDDMREADEDMLDRDEEED